MLSNKCISTLHTLHYDDEVFKYQQQTICLNNKWNEIMLSQFYLGIWLDNNNDLCMVNGKFSNNIIILFMVIHDIELVTNL